MYIYIYTYACVCLQACTPAFVHRESMRTCIEKACIRAYVHMCTHAYCFIVYPDTSTDTPR